jgi:hypothetical protein
MLQGRPRLVGPGFALLALTGAWLAHGLEYVRIAPRVGLADALGGPLHRAYMAPLGLALSIALVAGGAAWLRWWMLLGRRLDRARMRLRLGWRNNRLYTHAQTPLTEPSWGTRLTSLTAGLAVAQIVIYALQENVEAAAAGRTLPGAGVVVGVHWAAPLVHAGVALGLSATAMLLTSLLCRRVRAIIVCERLADSLAGRRAATVAVPAGRPAPRTPRDRFGSALWQRPPPPLLLPS